MISRISGLCAALAAVSSVSLSVFVGCGSTTSTGTAPTNTPDSGTPDSGGTVNPTPDGGAIAATQLASGQVFVDGITGDGYVIYDNGTTIYAVALTGGAPQTIGPFNPSNGDEAGTLGNLAVIGTGIDQSTGIGTLSVWSSANHLQTLSTTSVFAGSGTLGVSSDSAHIAYFDGASATTATANLMTAGPDGSGKTELVGAVQLIQSCAPQLTYGGTTLVASYCTNAVADAGGAQATVSSWAAGSTTATPIATDVAGYGVDPTHAHVLVSASNGLTVFPIAGGSGTTIDATGSFGGFTKDGANVIYTTTAGELKRSPIASPTPVLLLAGTNGVAQLDALSPDGNWALYTKSQDSSSGNFDLYVTSAATMGTPSTLSSTTSANLFGDAFTADSSHALFLNDISTSQSDGEEWGTLNAAPTAGGAPSTVSTNVVGYVALSTTKVVMGTNFADNQTGGTADIQIVDVTAPGSPSLVVSKADSYFLVTSDLSKVVYSTSTLTGSAQGVFVAPLP